MGREVIRLGTRKSRLAMAQAELAAAAIRKAAPGVEIELVPLVTTGDKILDRSLVEFGGKAFLLMNLNRPLQTAGLTLPSTAPRTCRPA